MGKARSDSWMRVYCNGKINDKSVILFEYAPTHNGDNAVRFLGGYSRCFVVTVDDEQAEKRNSLRKLGACEKEVCRDASDQERCPAGLCRGQ